MTRYVQMLKKLICFGLAGIIIWMAVPFYFGGGIEAGATEDTSGEIVITMPNFVAPGEAEPYTYSIEIRLRKYNSNNEFVSNTWSKDIKVNDSTFQLIAGEAILSNEKAGYSSGAQVTISELPISGTADGIEFAKCKIEIKIICSDITKKVTINGMESQIFEVTNNLTLTDGYELSDNAEIASQYMTTETFESETLKGQYNYRFLMNNFNVVTTDGDIESTHLVGAILSSQRAYGTIKGDGTFASTIPDAMTDRTHQGYLAVSDYSRGIFSYVNELTGINNEPTFKINYGEDDYALGDTKPTLYVSADKQNIIDWGDTDWYLRKYILPVGEQTANMFVSPNDSGDGDIYKNDDFIDFTQVTTGLTYTTEELVQALDGTEIEKINAEGKKELTLYSGHSYQISDASSITEIDLQIPEGYDFFLNPYPEPTIISFVGEIQTSKIGEGEHYILPAITVNGEELKAPKGEDGEFGERGNKIVWHFPDLVTDSETGNYRMSLGDTSQNIPGHILAPKVEIWNYVAADNGAFTWNGGNLNGSAMVKAFHSGETEIHMFPFDGREETGVIIRAEKTVDGTSYTSGEYSFTLDLAEGQSDVGILNGTTSTNDEGSVTKPDFPLTVSVQSDGSIEFPALSFSKAGTYEFVIKEVIPTDGSKGDGITYDLSEYTVKVIVTEDHTYQMDTAYTVLTSSYTITKTKDEHGNNITSSDGVNSITFNNTTGYSTSLTKKDANDSSLLQGAVFQVTEVTEKNGAYEDVSSGLNYQTTSNKEGIVFISSLVQDKIYKVEEITAPEGYSKEDGEFYIVSVNSSGTITVTKNGSGTAISDWVVTNQKAEYTLPLTGGSGTLAFYLVGTSCIGLALIMGMRKKGKKCFDMEEIRR